MQFSISIMLYTPHKAAEALKDIVQHSVLCKVCALVSGTQFKILVQLGD